MKILLVHDDVVLRRDLKVVLEFLDETVVECGTQEWQSAIAENFESTEDLALIFTQCGSEELPAFLALVDEIDVCVPVLLSGETSLDKVDEVLKKKVIAQLDSPLN